MTVRRRHIQPSCSTPIDAVNLADYWLGLLPQTSEDAVEEHLLACDGCGDRLREVIGLCEALRTLAHSGSLKVVVSDAFIQRAIAEGRQVRRYAPPRGGSLACTVSADDELLVGHLAADLSGATRVDISFCDARGIERQRMSDIPVDAQSGSIVYQESIVFAKSAPTSSMTARLLAIDADGTERILGEYIFNHTRTISGPPDWEEP